MQHLHKVMRLSTKDVLEVNLTSSAYVYLMDEENYEKYLADEPFEYYGQLVTNGHIRIKPPFLDHWHLVIQQESQAADLQVSIRLISRAG